MSMAFASLTFISSPAVMTTGEISYIAKVIAKDGFEYCSTYKSPTAGTEIIFEKCDEQSDLKRWLWVELEQGKIFPAMSCIIDGSLCAGVGEKDNNIYLKEKDENDPTQIWTGEGKSGQFKNQLKGESMCLEVVFPKSVPAHSVMKKCDRMKHKHQMGHAVKSV